MIIPFSKYNGAGNDFVLVDNRQDDIRLTADQIAHICHRRFGVGADGLILLGAPADGYDFVMQYFNSDGLPADMCGNGARCIVAFAHTLGFGHPVDGKPTFHFLAGDGPHQAEIIHFSPASQSGLVTIHMKDVDNITSCLDGWLLNTGVPHYVQFVNNLDTLDVAGEGRRIRHLPQLGPQGANVNFVQLQPDGRLDVRTYERGVEDETWACGTGVTASAIVTGCNNIRTRGGDFSVSFQRTANTATAIRLTGPVALNFTGQINL